MNTRRQIAIGTVLLLTLPNLAFGQQRPQDAGPDRGQSRTDTQANTTSRPQNPPAAPGSPSASRPSAADPSATADAAAGPAAEPAVGTPLKAVVIEVEGNVEFATGDADMFDTSAWAPVELNMELGANTQIRTGIRSHCTLQFGSGPDITVIQLRRATLARISDYRRTIDEQRIRIGLGYGAVRGGSTEGTLRSDVVVDSTVATLAKRGTEGWEIEIEPISGTFRISLAQSGLVEAFSKALGRGRDVSPDEYATGQNIARMWINQDIFDRAVRFYEPFALSVAEIDFLSEQTTGYAHLGAGSNQLFDDVGRRPTTYGLPTNPLPWLGTVILQPLPVRRPEGNFGFAPTFRVLVGRERH